MLYEDRLHLKHLHLRQLFGRFRIPNAFVSDNGTQYTSSECGALQTKWNIYMRTPPYHPQSNEQAENFFDILKRVLLKIREETLQQVLISYGITPSPIC